MNKKIIILTATLIILALAPLILAETLEVRLRVDGLNPTIETNSYEGYEFDVTVFTDYSVTLLNLFQYHITQEPSFSFGEFTAKLTTSNGQELSSSIFQPNFYILTNPPTETDTDIVTLNFEYYNEAEYLEVYHEGEQKLRVNIQDLLCNYNSICDENENFLSCSNDCKLYSEDGLCSGYDGDNYCDVDCFIDSDCDQDNCNDNERNQDETSIDQGGVCAQEDCTLKELSGVMTCGDGMCDSCEDIFSCEVDCEINEDICPPAFFKLGRSCESQIERIHDWRDDIITFSSLIEDIRNSFFSLL